MPRPHIRHGAAIALLSCAAAFPMSSGAQEVPDVEGDPAIGQRILWEGGCQACHNGEESGYLAGGHRLVTPFGPLLTPNITPDIETGLGDWTYEEFRRVLWEGISPGNTILYPGMPYMHYTKMVEQDVRDLWAYLQTVEPIEHEVEVNQMPFPFNIRESLISWRILYFEAGRFEPEENRSELYNRGAYLVEGAGHCGSCHTPRNPIGGPIESQKFEGAIIRDWYAPDISNGPGSIIGSWEIEELADYLAGDMPNNHVAVGPMDEVVYDTRELPREDLVAMATYLKSRGNESGEAPPELEEPSQAFMEAGAQIYEENCRTCHAEDGRGEPGVAASLAGAGSLNGAYPETALQVLYRGIAPTEHFGVMPSFRNALSPAEIGAVTTYISNSFGNGTSPNVTAAAAQRIGDNYPTAEYVSEAVQCPNIPSNLMDPFTRAALTELAAAPAPEPEAFTPIVEAYRERHPTVDTSTTATNLTGIYCQNLALNGLDRDTVAARTQEMTIALEAN